MKKWRVVLTVEDLQNFVGVYADTAAMDDDLFGDVLDALCVELSERTGYDVGWRLGSSPLGLVSDEPERDAEIAEVIDLTCTDIANSEWGQRFEVAGLS